VRIAGYLPQGLSKCRNSVKPTFLRPRRLDTTIKRSENFLDRYSNIRAVAAPERGRVERPDVGMISRVPTNYSTDVTKGSARGASEGTRSLRDRQSHDVKGPLDDVRCSAGASAARMSERGESSAGPG